MKKLLLAAVILLSLSSKAQVLSMAQIPPAIDGDTISPGFISTDNIWIRNVDTSNSFNDLITIVTAVRDSINPAQLDTVSNFTTSLVAIGPSDTVMLSLNNLYNVGGINNYRYGIDVIVVWPVAATGATGPDSLEFIVFIEPPTGIHELDLNEIIRLYPNPSAEKISIDPKGKAQVAEVTIYDMNGRIVLSRKNETCIDVNALAPGMYTVDVVLSDKKHYSLKFLRQNSSSE